MDNEYFNNLPHEILKLIYDFIPIKNLIFLNKKCYNLYHSLIKYSVNFSVVIRDVIRRDNDFVLQKLIDENINKLLNLLVNDLSLLK